jgi:hypothetical protein
MNRPSNIVPLHRCVPIRPATNDQGMILGEPVDLYESFSHEPIRDPAVGGRGGLVLMLLVAFAIGVLLAGAF